MISGVAQNLLDIERLAQAKNALNRMKQHGQIKKDDYDVLWSFLTREEILLVNTITKVDVLNALMDMSRPE